MNSAQSQHHSPLLEGFPLSAIGFVDSLLSQAVRLGASDAHIERTRAHARLRYRLDGVLFKVESGTFLFDDYAAIVARIRILAALDIAERHLPQDGRFSYVCEYGAVDVRVSVLHTVSGERIALRILRSESENTDFVSLGMPTRETTIMERVMHASQGMVLVTGPTGSGKTTTLYTALKQVNTDEVNVLAVEDPVEQRLDGVGQVQVNEQTGVSFADSLGAFLRQDPEVILVGEIRDKETADTAFKAALTGHLVLSTLHTKDSAATIARLVNIGLPVQLISSSLSLVLAQRLVRVLCPHCKVEQASSADVLGPDDCSDVRLFAGHGCEQCAWTGYHGRRGVFEMLEVNDSVADAIRCKAPAGEIRQLMSLQGGVDLAHGMRRLLLAGVVDIAEYQRVLP